MWRLNLIKDTCSCGEQIRYVRHKCYLTSICNLLSRLPPDCYMSFVDISVWTREGLPVEETPTLKLVKILRKSNLVIKGVMNAYL